MGFKIEGGKVILLALSDQQRRLLSDAQFGSMKPMSPDSKTKMRGSTQVNTLPSIISDESGDTRQIL